MQLAVHYITTRHCKRLDSLFRFDQLSQAGPSNGAVEDLDLLSFLKLCEEKVTVCDFEGQPL